MQRSPGADDLARYLRSRGLNVTTFAAKYGVDRVHLQRVLFGDRGRRISVDFAYVIHRATRGRVRWDRWVSPVLVEDAAA